MFYYGETRDKCINILSQIICMGQFDINTDSIFVDENGTITGYSLGKVAEEDKIWYEAEFYIEECDPNLIDNELDIELVKDVENLLQEIIKEK